MFKYGLNRAAAITVRIAYIISLYAGIYLLFQHIGVEKTPMGYVLNIAIPVAVLLHEFLQQQTVIGVFRQLLHNHKSKDLWWQMGFHAVTLLLLTGFDAYCVWQISPAALVIPALFFLSSVLVEAEEDAEGLLARNEHVMLMRTTRTMVRQWKQRIKAAEKSGIDLSEVGAVLMEDVHNDAGARRIRIINRALTNSEQSRPNKSLSTKSGKSINLYSAPAQATSGAKPMQFPTQTVNENPDDIQGKRHPRRAIPRTPKARVYRILDRMENPVGVDLTELARAAKCDWKTARKHYNNWMEVHSIQLAM